MAGGPCLPGLHHSQTEADAFIINSLLAYLASLAQQGLNKPHALPVMTGVVSCVRFSSILEIAVQDSTRLIVQQVIAGT